MIRFKRHFKLEHGLKQIDIAPLIDIVFLLLIFFMLTSQFVIQAGFPIKLPRAATSQFLGELDITLVITSEGILYHNNQPLSFKELHNFLRKMGVRRVFIRADKNAKLEVIVKVWDICREEGIEKVHIATIKR